jgi:hypothetical protein
MRTATGETIAYWYSSALDGWKIEVPIDEAEQADTVVPLTVWKHREQPFRTEHVIIQAWINRVTWALSGTNIRKDSSVGKQIVRRTIDRDTVARDMPLTYAEIRKALDELHAMVLRDTTEAAQQIRAVVS